MRRYECVVVLDPEVPDDDVRLFSDRFSTVINTGGGEIIKIEDWGLKRLAYLVRKKERGRYILFDFVGVPALIAEMERQLKIAEEVMKFLSVKLDDEVDLEAFKAASQEAKAAAEAPQEPAPAETAEAPVAVEAAEEASEQEATAEPQPEATEPAPAEELSTSPEATETEAKKEGEQA